MRRLAAALSALALVSIAGCGSQTDGETAPSAAPAALAQQGPVTLTVATSLSTDGPLYTEGALARIVLRDAAGDVVGAETKRPGRQFVFEGLSPGTYVLEPALRPCDGNCGYLDPPTDSCRRLVIVDSDLTLKVRFSVGGHCLVGRPRGA